MKDDLKKLVNYYNNHPERNLINVQELIQYPPVEGNFLVSDIYDQMLASTCKESNYINS